MTNVPFSVSARTALLIGQQNFTNAEGAIIELVKNAYDADSKFCLLLFDIPFSDVPIELSEEVINAYALHDLVKRGYYKLAGKTFLLQIDSRDESFPTLKDSLNIHNRIYIVDSGNGMTSKVISDQWMTIGTGNKDRDHLSDGGRVQTGAKGIGRFALDRLGRKTRLWTRPKDEKDTPTYWEMDWTQFESPKLKLSQVKAKIHPQKGYNLSQKVAEKFSSFLFYNDLPEDAFNSGTLIEIGNLRDEWTTKEIDNVFKGLEALIPPKELLIPFNVFQGYSQSPRLYGEVKTAFFNDYDYKMTAKFNAGKLSVDFEFDRNELDLKVLKEKYPSVYENAAIPFDLNTLKKRIFKFSKPVEQVIKWKKSEKNIDRLKQVGDFDFVFYFLKIIQSKKEDYPYKGINSSERQSTLNRFGGIKIYRDSFRVRPYGDPDNDWLDLGRRAGKSPAGAGQRIGDWRVGSNQVAGIVQISRLENEQLTDKSDRGALVENDAFNLFKRILTGIINQFEVDRSTVLHPIYLFNEAENKRKEEEHIMAEAQILAEKIYQARVAEEKSLLPKEESDGGDTQRDQSATDAYAKMAEESLRKFHRPEEKDAEIAQVRSLASLGLIMASFAHELRNVQYNTNEVEELEVIYEKIASDIARETKDFQNGKDIMELLKLDQERVRHWVDYSLTSIKKDKRQRKTLYFPEYFAALQSDWEYALADRMITLDVNTVVANYEFRAYEMDMNTIFSNLITNSIDSFLSAEEIFDRQIKITQVLKGEVIEIVYFDNGPGLPDIFSDFEEVFLPFTTSKKDKDGQDIGTGLGMYLVKNVVQDYNGSVNILERESGFSLKIEFPIRKINANV